MSNIFQVNAKVLPQTEKKCCMLRIKGSLVLTHKRHTKQGKQTWEIASLSTTKQIYLVFNSRRCAVVFSVWSSLKLKI